MESEILSMYRKVISVLIGKVESPEGRTLVPENFWYMGAFHLHFNLLSQEPIKPESTLSELGKGHLLFIFTWAIV